MAQAILLVGDDHLSVRLRQLLEGAGCRVQVTARTLAPGDYDAVVVASEDDGLNLDLALAALERWPTIRLVIRIDHLTLAQGLRERLPQATILCPPAMAAPTFAAAIMHPGLWGALEHGGTLYVLWETPTVPPESQLLATAADGMHLVLIPWDEAQRYLPLTAPDWPAGRYRRRLGQAFRRWQPDTIAFTSAAFLVLLLLTGTLYFAYSQHLSLLDAFYFTATTVATVGYGDISLRHADTVSKLVGIVTMFLGVAATAVITALLTDWVFSRRMARARGHHRSREHHHVVLAGLGRLGYSILQVLQRMGERVVVIEPHPDPNLAKSLQQERVHLIIGDATHSENLRYAHLAAAKVLVAATDNDVTNTQIALAAIGLRPDLRTVLRVFGPDLARRAHRFLGIGRTLSATRLVAGAFAAAALGKSGLRLSTEWRELTVELSGTETLSVHVHAEPMADPADSTPV